MKIFEKNKFATLSMVSVIISVSVISGCSNPFAKEETVQQTETPAKEIEIFTVGQKNDINFSKNGEIKSATQAIVMPETSGKVTKISVKLGDKVRKGQTLITLGNSLSSEVTRLNYETALESLDKINDSLIKLDQSAQTSIRSTLLNYYTAKESFETALKTRENSDDLYEEQEDYLDDTIDDLKDALDAMEEIPEGKSTPAYQETLAKYKQLKSQQDQAEISRDIQTDQTDLSIDVARRQLEGAILAVESVQNQYSLQFIQTESGLLQAKNGAELAKLQKEALNVKSPISGTITSIDATLNNLTGPGQVVAIVQDLDSMEITTSINEDELALIKTGDSVMVSTNEITTTGAITEISPALSAYNKKITVKIKLSSTTGLISGQFAEIKFAPKTQKIFLPLKTVSIENDKYFVKVISTDRTVEKRQIKRGRIIGSFIEVTEGLSDGEVIAISTSTFLKDGDKVAYKVPRQ